MGVCGGKDGIGYKEHKGYEGMIFNPEVGILTSDGYKLPGLEVGCSCFSSALVEGFD